MIYRIQCIMILSINYYELIQHKDTLVEHQLNYVPLWQTDNKQNIFVVFYCPARQTQYVAHIAWWFKKITNKLLTTYVIWRCTWVNIAKCRNWEETKYVPVTISLLLLLTKVTITQTPLNHSNRRISISGGLSIFIVCDWIKP